MIHSFACSGTEAFFNRRAVRRFKNIERVRFVWNGDGANLVEIVDYH